MRVNFANQHHCTVPFQSRAGVNFNWYDSIYLCSVYSRCTCNKDTPRTLTLKPTRALTHACAKHPHTSYTYSPAHPHTRTPAHPHTYSPAHPHTHTLTHPPTFHTHSL